MSGWKSRWSWVRLVKPGGGEANAGHPLELERMRRHLHRAGAVAGVDHPPQRRLQVDALGRRPRDGLHRAAHPRLDRAQHPGRALGRFEDRVDEVDGGGLAVRAGHADHAQLGARDCRRRRPQPRPSPAATSRRRAGARRPRAPARRSAPTAPLAIATPAKSCPSATKPGTHTCRAPGRAASAR